MEFKFVWGKSNFFSTKSNSLLQDPKNIYLTLMVTIAPEHSGNLITRLDFHKFCSKRFKVPKYSSYSYNKETYEELASDSQTIARIPIKDFYQTRMPQDLLVQVPTEWLMSVTEDYLEGNDMLP
jgi:hypothetical protein